MKSENIQILWSELIIQELLRLGVTFFGYAPGSRNAPFAAALVSNKVSPVVHYDERGLAFAALGAAKASRSPSVIIATSGSAGVNFMPALVEAKESGVPLIVITGDRPPELLEVGEGQTIDQVKMYENFSCGFFDLPCPTETAAPQFVLSTVDALFFKALDARGPVHLNAHFREPLYPQKVDIAPSYLDPIASWLKSNHPHTTWQKSGSIVSIELPDELINAKRGALVLGRLESDEEVAAALQLIETLKWPVFPDLSSHLAYHASSYILPHFDWILAAYGLGEGANAESLVPEHLKFDAVLQIGHEFLSKRLRLFLKDQRPYLVTIAKGQARYDPGHVTRLRIAQSIKDIDQSAFLSLGPSKSLEQLQRDHARAQKMLEKSPGIHTAIAKSMPDGTNLFLASSFSIREFGWFSTKCSVKRAFANRGASGIDGLIATAFGVSYALGEPVVLCIGDLAFCYDVNSLSLLKSFRAPLTIILFNNGGGGIFHLLPIAEHKDVFPLLEAKHSIDIEALSEAFNLKYKKIPFGCDLDALSVALKGAYESKSHTIVEIEVKSEEQAKKVRSMVERSRKEVAIPPLVKTG